MDQELTAGEISIICYQAARDVKLIYRSKWTSSIDSYLRYYHDMNFNDDHV